MPKMNGIDFIKKLLPQYPIPVIVLSGASDAVFDAMDAGAVDFVSKPDMQSPRSVETFLYDLIEKIKVAANAKVNQPIQPEIIRPTTGTIDMSKIIAIGASTGGTEAICYVLKQLPPNMPGILIVQHIPPMFSRLFAERLNQQTSFIVKEAQSGDYIEPGKVLVAPGDQHMRIKKIGDKYKVDVFHGEKVNGHCPSVDILFESVAHEAGKSAVGVMLTGMGYDGAKGMLSMKRKGARTIGQDEASSVVYGMPKVAYEIGAVEKQVNLTHIPGVLVTMLK
jgi:two-component system chemotaxis response regulator CheB